MKSKTIKKALRAKLNAWLRSIEDETVRNLVKKNTIVTGGSIASMLLQEKVNDYDVYFKNKETVLAVAQYYVDEFNKANPGRKTRIGTDGKAYIIDCDDKTQIKRETEECAKLGPIGSRGAAGHLLNLHPGRVKIVIRSDGVASARPEIMKEPIENAVEAIDEISAEDLDSVESDPYKPIFLSSNAITLSGRIQIVVRFYGEPDKIHETYDFVHCTNYYDLGEDKLVLKAEALECLLTKELKYTGSKYPLCSIIRTRKFVQRGFTVNAGQYLKMCFQLNELDLTDLAVLEDQLVGVDSAYFMQLISAIQAKMASDPDFSIDQTYVGTIIDRIF